MAEIVGSKVCPVSGLECDKAAQAVSDNRLEACPGALSFIGLDDNNKEVYEEACICGLDALKFQVMHGAAIAAAEGRRQAVICWDEKVMATFGLLYALRAEEIDTPSDFKKLRINRVRKMRIEHSAVIELSPHDGAEDEE